MADTEQSNNHEEDIAATSALANEPATVLEYMSGLLSINIEILASDATPLPPALLTAASALGTNTLLHVIAKDGSEYAPDALRLLLDHQEFAHTAITGIPNDDGHSVWQLAISNPDHARAMYEILSSLSDRHAEENPEKTVTPLAVEVQDYAAKAGAAHDEINAEFKKIKTCLLYTSPSPRDS